MGSTGYAQPAAFHPPRPSQGMRDVIDQSSLPVSPFRNASQLDGRGEAITQVLREGAIGSAETYSVRRVRKHGVATSFELAEPRLGTHLTATLEKGITTTYSIWDWRTGETLGWLCSNAKGDTFVLYESADLGGVGGPEPVATMALSWKLSPQDNRQVDAITLSAKAYRSHRSHENEWMPVGSMRDRGAVTGQSQAADTKFIWPPRPPSTPRAAQSPATSILSRRHQQKLEVSVSPSSSPTITAKRPASGSPGAETSWLSGPGGFSLKRKSKNLRVDVDLDDISPMRPLEDPLLTPEEAKTLADEEAAMEAFGDATESPMGSLRQALQAVTQKLRRSSSSGYVPVPQGDEASQRSPVSVLSPTAIQGPAPLPSPQPSLSLSTRPITSGHGGPEIMNLLNRLMAKGVEEVDLPEAAMAFRSARPTWSAENQCNTLSFGGLVHQKSVKNMVLLALGDGHEVAHPAPHTTPRKGSRGHGPPSHLREQLISQEECYNEELGRRTLIVGRQSSTDGSDFVVSHDPRSLSKTQAFAMAVASCTKKAVFIYL